MLHYRNLCSCSPLLDSTGMTLLQSGAHIHLLRAGKMVLMLLPSLNAITYSETFEAEAAAWGNSQIAIIS